MRKSIILKMLLTALLCTIIAASLALFVSAEEEGATLYEVTLESGTVEKVTEKKAFGDLISNYPDAKAIKLYTNLEINKVNNSRNNYVTADLDIDLNGYTITSNDAYIRPSGAKVTVHGGKIVHYNSYFVFMQSTSGEFIIDGCEITAVSNFVHERNGSITIKNSTITSDAVAGTTGSLIQLSYAGQTSSLLIDGCTFDSANISLINVGRQSDSVEKNITVKDTVFNTTKSVVTFSDQPGAANAPVTFTFEGTTKLSYESFTATAPGVSNTSLIFSEGVKLSSVPTIELGRIGFADGATSFSENTDADSEKYPTVAIKGTYLYELTMTDGSTVTVDSVKSFADLISDYESVKAIKLYYDLEIGKVNEKPSNRIYSDLDIDLNGYTITANGGYLRPESSSNVRVHGGNIVHTNSYFVFIDSNEASISIENCSISAANVFLHLRNGSAALKSSTVDMGATESGVFTQLSYAGDTTTLEIDGCTFADTSFALLSIGRTGESIAKSVTVKDTVFNTSGKIISFSDQSDATTATVDVSFTGKTKLSFDSFSNEPLINTTTFIFGDGVMVSKVPTVNMGTVTFSGGADGFVESGDEKYPYVATNTKPRYTIKMSDGEVKSIYNKSTLGELINIADSGSLITLYSDVDLPSEISTTGISNKNVDINLNGYTLTNSGARLRAYGSSKITVYGGKIVDSSDQQFLFTGSTDSDKNLVWIFDDCEITASGSFIQLRNGSLTFKNSKIVSENVSTLVAFSTAGSHASLTVDNCTVELGDANFVSISRSETTLERTVNIIDSTVHTGGKLISFGQGMAPEGATTNINILGETKLKYSSLDGNTNTDDRTVVAIDVGVKMSTPPTLSIGTVALNDGAEGIMKSDDNDYFYVVSEKIPITVKPMFSLTLYTDFTMNLCFDKSYQDDIISVKMGDTEITPFVENGYLFYAIGGISPLDAAKKQIIDLTYRNYGMPVTKTLEYSVTDYISALLKSNYSTESKEMISRTTDYISAVSLYVGEEELAEIGTIKDSEEYAAIGKDGWINKVPESSQDSTALLGVIDSARFVISSNVKFRFYLADGIGNGELTVKSKTVSKSYTVNNSLIGDANYFDVEMRAFELYDGTVEISFGDKRGTYDFKAYANSEIAKDGEEKLEALILSMYNYFREANEYMKVSYKDFKPAASIVVKDGKDGTVTYVFDDGDLGSSKRLGAMLPDYENLAFSFALITDRFATLETKLNEETGKYEYVLDENGNYVYTINEEAVEYFRELNLLYDDRVEYISHSHAHKFQGYDDEGGTVKYVDTDGNIKTVTLPVGSATANYYAAKQILNDLFGEDGYGIARAGISAKENDVTIDGITYKGYLEYYLTVLERMYNEGRLISVRRGSGKAITHEYLSTMEGRLSVPSYSIKDYQDPATWRQHIDDATAIGGWSVFCIHRIFTDDTVSDAFHLKVSQIRDLFAYTDRDNVWVATYEVAAKYYSEWSTAEVKAEMKDGVIIVELTDKENNEIYDEALTVKVTVPSRWKSCMVNGGELEIKTDENGTSFVYLNIVPDSGTVEISGK